MTQPWIATVAELVVALYRGCTGAPVAFRHTCPVCDGTGKMNVIVANAPNGENKVMGE